MGKAKRLAVTQTATIYRNGSTDDTDFTRETVVYRFPDAFRCDSVASSAQRIHVAASGLALTIVDQKVVAHEGNRFDRYKDLLLHRTRGILEKELPLLGVDVEVSSLGRFEDKIGYVVGARYPDETVSQVWVDKETFHPVRWLMVTVGSTGTADLFEVRYSQWRQTENTWYPMHIEFYQDGVLVREITVEAVSVDAPVSDTLFDIQQLQALYPAETAEESLPPDSDPLAEEQETINKFEERYKDNQ
jgi:outer membrane lipoprotein-sorting protein